MIGTQNNYKYNGKELNEELGLDWYDYGARNYDPAIGRFFNVDPLADAPIQLDKSPFAYTWNNPINLTDSTGMHPDWNEDMYSSLTAGGSGSDLDGYIGNKVDEHGPIYVTSTYVDSTGKIIKHVDDGDPNIYLVNDPDNWDGTSSDLKIIGTEREGVTYTPGNTIVQEDLNEGFFLINGYLATKLTKSETVVGGPGVLEYISVGSLIKIGSWLQRLFKLKKAAKLAKSQLKAIRSLKRQIKIHKKKLKNYKRNPDKYDNKGFLKTAPPSLRKKIINTRIQKLSREIQKFKNEIKKIEIK